MQANKNTSVLEKKHPFTYRPAAKHQTAANAAKSALQTYMKN